MRTFLRQKCQLAHVRLNPLEAIFPRGVPLHARGRFDCGGRLFDSFFIKRHSLRRTHSTKSGRARTGACEGVSLGSSLTGSSYRLNVLKSGLAGQTGARLYSVKKRERTATGCKARLHHDAYTPLKMLPTPRFVARRGQRSLLRFKVSACRTSSSARGGTCIRTASAVCRRGYSG